MSCDVSEVTERLENDLDAGEAKERLENELCCISISMSSAHSTTFLSLHLHHNSFSNPSSLYLCHSSFSNPSIASPTSQFILQPFFCFFYVTSSSLNSPGKPPTMNHTSLTAWLHLSFVYLVVNKVHYIFEISFPAYSHRFSRIFLNIGLYGFVIFLLNTKTLISQS